jgi:hypothetical protein
VQTPELQHDEEQEEDDRAPGAEQVLPVLPEAHGAQGNKVGIADLGLRIADWEDADAPGICEISIHNPQSAIRN